MPEEGWVVIARDSLDTRAVRDHIEVLILLVLGAGLRLFRLGAESLWLDEQWMVVLAQERTLWETLWVVPTNNPHPPLYFLVSWLWLNALGPTSALVARLPSMIFGIVSVPLFYLLARRLFGRRVAIVSGLVFAIHPVLLWYAQEARMYALLVLLVLASYYLLLRVVEQNSPALTASYVLTAVFIGYTHVYGLFVIFSQALFVAWWRRYGKNPNPVSGRRLVGIYTGVGALTLPWTGFLLVRHLSPTPVGQVPAGWIGPPQASDIIEAVRFFSFGVTETTVPFARLAGPPDAFYAVVLLAVALLVGGFTTGYLRDEADELGALVLVLFWVTIPVLVPFLVSVTIRPMFQLRYLVVVIPAFILLVVRGVALVPNRWARYAVLGLLVAGLVVPLPSYYAHDQKGQWRETAEFVESRAGADDVVVIVPAWTNRTFQYYFDEPTVAVRAMWSWDSVQAYRNATAEHSNVYLVLSYATTEERERTIDRLARARGEPPTDRRYFVKTVVVHWSRDESTTG